MRLFLESVKCDLDWNLSFRVLRNRRLKNLAGPQSRRSFKSVLEGFPFHGMRLQVRTFHDQILVIESGKLSQLVEFAEIDDLLPVELPVVGVRTESKSGQTRIMKNRTGLDRNRQSWRTPLPEHLQT